MPLGLQPLPDRMGETTWPDQKANTGTADCQSHDMAPFACSPGMIESRPNKGADEHGCTAFGPSETDTRERVNINPTLQ